MVDRAASSGTLDLLPGPHVNGSVISPPSMSAKADELAEPISEVMEDALPVSWTAKTGRVERRTATGQDLGGLGQRTCSL